MIENKKISMRLTKEDIRMLQSLCADYGETTTNVLKHALHFLYHSREPVRAIERDKYFKEL